MNRAIDGQATAAEREQLARILRANPLLRSQFEELQAVHASTESLFRQLSLPGDFSARVMRRVQGVDVPGDTGLENVRLPARRRRRRALITQSRNPARVYAIVAAVSAAAAVVLAVGVFSGAFARAGIGGGPDEKTVAEGRRGVPDTGELNRTDSPTPQPLGSTRPEAPAGDTDQPEETSVTTPGGESKQPGAVPPPSKTQPDRPENPEDESPSQPEPKPEEVVKHEPQTGPDQPEPEDPGDTVEQPGPKTPAGGRTAAGPAGRDVVGKLLVVSGRAELVNADGSSTRLQDKDQQVFRGDRIRTRYGAVVLLQLPGGEVTLGKDTQVVLDSDNGLTLEQYNGSDKGQLALDRGERHSGQSLEVRCEDYSLQVTSGMAVVERKRRGLLITKASGFSTVSHQTLGSLLLEEAGGCESEIDFGKAFTPPKARRVTLPGWSCEARSQTVMQALEPAIQARQFKQVGERPYLLGKLPARLEKLLEHASSTDSTVAWLRAAIANEKLEAGEIVKMASEVEIAYFDVTELTPDVINGHADRAATTAESFDQWREYFYRLMRPPVEPKHPPSKPIQGGTGAGGDCPTANKDKLKRVDEPPGKKVRPIPPKQGEDTAKEEDKPSS